MAKYPKKAKPTRSMERGLRSFSPQSPDNFPKEKIDKAIKIIEAILADSRTPDAKTKWMIDHALLVINFRQESIPERRNRITIEVNRHEDKGHSLGFERDEIWAIARAVVKMIGQKHQVGELEDFRQKLLARREEEE